MAATATELSDGWYFVQVAGAGDRVAQAGGVQGTVPDEFFRETGFGVLVLGDDNVKAFVEATLASILYLERDPSATNNPTLRRYDVPVGTHLQFGGTNNVALMKVVPIR